MIWLALGAAFLLGLIIGYVWGWRRGVRVALECAETVFQEIERTAVPFVVRQREAAERGEQ